MRQQDLFSDEKHQKADDKRGRLWRAIDLINADSNAKFRQLGAPGKDAAVRKYVTLASQSSVDLNYLGAKIAFSRVPEESEFLF